MESTRSLAELERELNDQILAGGAMEAFDAFYADECMMQEGSEEPTVGKAANGEREVAFFAGVTELRALALRDVSIGDGVTMSTWHFDYTHAEWGPQSYDQVAVRHWSDGKIVRERFFKA